MAEPHQQADATTKSRHRRVLGTLLTLAGLAFVWVVLFLPNTKTAALSPATYARLPLELLVVAAVGLALKGRARTWVAGAVGVVIGVLALLRLLDQAFTRVLLREFNPLSDAGYLASFTGVVQDSVGPVGAVLLVAGAVLLAVVVLVGVPWTCVRLARSVSRHRGVALPIVSALAALWVLAYLAQSAVVPGTPAAARETTLTVASHVHQLQDGAVARTEIQQAAASDPYATTPGSRLLTGLRGKDVVLVVVESYGRVAVEDPVVSPPVRAALSDAQGRLSAVGYSARSGFLTSPTYSGISWLAHATIQSGVWADTQPRYDYLVSSGRTTLSSTFQRAGWRTVFIDPANHLDFPPARSFYRSDTVYDSRNLGYSGPAFSYGPVPDQFTLHTFATRELAGAGSRPPVMAEIDLVSSHTPWTPLPRLLPPDQLGDGSVFSTMTAGQPSPAEVIADPAVAKRQYAQSVAYTIGSLASFVETTGDPNLVMIVVGDHQPSPNVSGERASHDVPISLVARDPTVLQAISSWGWQDSLVPGPAAPVWRMDAFRDRFLAAYGPAATAERGG